MTSQTYRIRGTIVTGLAFGLVFIPLCGLSEFFMPPVAAFCLTLWLYLAIYSRMMAGWARRRLAAICVPVALPLAAATGAWLYGSPATVILWLFLGLSLAVLSWIRSGVCFPESPVLSLGAEILICFGGAVLVAAFDPRSAAGQALGIFLFFLVQALYFLFFTRSASPDSDLRPDPFETARIRAESILTQY